MQRLWLHGRSPAVWCRLWVLLFSRPNFLVAPSCPPVAVFLAQERLAGRDHVQASSVEFDVVALSDSMGWEVVPVKRALRQLQWSPTLQTGEGLPGPGGSRVRRSALPTAPRPMSSARARPAAVTCLGAAVPRAELPEAVAPVGLCRALAA